MVVGGASLAVESHNFWEGLVRRRRTAKARVVEAKARVAAERAGASRAVAERAGASRVVAVASWGFQPAPTVAQTAGAERAGMVMAEERRVATVATVAMMGSQSGGSGVVVSSSSRGGGEEAHPFCESTGVSPLGDPATMPCNRE